MKILENTDIWLIGSENPSHIKIIDKQWGNVEELRGSKATDTLAMLYQKRFAHTNPDSKEYDLAWNSVLAGIYYSI